jgi:hypothetical protein
MATVAFISFIVTNADSDEGDRGSGLMVISIPGSM